MLSRTGKGGVLLNIRDQLIARIPREDYHYYDCRPEIMKGFLRFGGSFLDRQKIAIQQIEYIVSVNKKKELLSRVTTELAKIEYSIRELQPWARDHVVHALLSFILGIYLESALLRCSSDKHFDPLQWKLAGLFHDVGYPSQIAREALLHRLASAINETRNGIGVSRPDIYPRIELVNIDRLQGSASSFDIIQERLDNWGLKINAKQEYIDTRERSDVCHGMVSSLALLYLLDALYERYNPDRLHKPVYVDGADFDQTYFERDIVSACSAIYIHNLPSRCFDEAKIDRSKAPAAFLLRLSDTFQEWERPSLKNTSGFSPDRFSMDFEDGALIYRVNVPAQKIGKMMEDLSTLAAPDIEIRWRPQ